MSKAPEKCLYCKRDDPNCGFCEMGKPLDTQADWDNSWGKIFHTPIMYDTDGILYDFSKNQPVPTKKKKRKRK